MNDSTTDQQAPWVKAPVSNLVRYKPSGAYFARAKVGGKLIRQSLKTNVLSIAKLRLKDLLAGDRISLRLAGAEREAEEEQRPPTGAVHEVQLREDGGCFCLHGGEGIGSCLHGKALDEWEH